MVQINETFNPAEVPEDERSFELIPAGVYKVQVIESKIEDTSNQNGQMLVLTLEIIDGQYQNRRLWDRLNIRNQNPDAQRIAQRALADLCLAIGVAQLRDTEELHFKPLNVKVLIKQPTQKDKDAGYDQPKNTVRYTVGKAGVTGAQGARPASAPAARGAQPPARPWGAGAKAAAVKAEDPPF